jgi:hypothetical protein
MKFNPLLMLIGMFTTERAGHLRRNFELSGYWLGQVFYVYRFHTDASCFSL